MNSLRKLLFFSFLLLPLLKAYSQQKDLPKGWHLLDKSASGYYGISLDKAIEFVRQKNLKSKPVVIAVIDTGIDTTHPAIKPALWKNPGEIAGNGIDDDKNGYTDDISGWNFLGSRDGNRNVEKDSDIELRIYYRFKDKWKDSVIDGSILSPAEAENYRTWKKASEMINNSRNASMKELKYLLRSFEKCGSNDSILRIAMDRTVYTGAELTNYYPNTEEGKKARQFILNIMSQNNALSFTNVEFLHNYEAYIKNEEQKIYNNYSEPYPYRNSVTGDNYFDINDRYYGNNNIMVSSRSALHGTYVAGIIGAANRSEQGFRSIADNVRIIFIKATNDGSEHEKDIALAIKYAVENGARIINMSFGNPLSVEKKWVDDAVKFAAENNVLLVHASSNSASDYDQNRYYPDPGMLDGSYAPNWITVGSSSDYSSGTLVAGFSSYGKKSIDVFAPGIKIYSTAPGNTYQSFQGSSAAAAVVSGLAAFLLQYYPKLSAVQLKHIIEKSVSIPEKPVLKPGTGEMVPFSELCRTGGIVNAYEAIKLAAKTRPAKPAFISR